VTATVVSRRGARHTYCTQGDRDGGVGGGGCRFSLGARRRRRGRSSRREYHDRPEGRPPAAYTSSVFSAATAYVYDTRVSRALVRCFRHQQVSSCARPSRQRLLQENRKIQNKRRKLLRKTEIFVVVNNIDQILLFICREYYTITVFAQ